jgi:elongation factor P--(R)-beta-lysine ligase
MTLDESSRLSHIRPRLEYRASIINGIRAFFCREGFLEIESPLRVPAIAPEQFILPYTSEGWFLSTSPELQMKRLLSAGYEKIFQICHCFRQDECGRHHNPEFTMLEWYRSGGNYRHIIQDTENLIISLAYQLGYGLAFNYRGQKIDLTLPWPEITVQDAYLRWAGWDPLVDFNGTRFDDDMADKIIPHFVPDRPTVIRDYPLECASLARVQPGNPQVAERAEVFIGGLEIANGYSELNNTEEQKKRFQWEMEQMQKAGKPAVWPQKFLEAVGHLPECGGIALGVDRLVMLLTDAESIDDVMAFPADLL